MSNDIKTLADAQPGGRVQVMPSDAARALLAAQYRDDGDKAKAIRINHKSLTDSDKRALRAIEAALSAQPSPDGQDALPRPLEDLRDALQHAIDCADGGDDYNCGRPMIDAMTTLGLMRKTGRGLWSVNVLDAQAVVEALASRQQARIYGCCAQPVGEAHADDLAVDAFAAAMKAKMAEARAKGRGGWEDPAQCSADDLSRMLRNHVEKGDPRDVANFCMMLHQRGEAIAASYSVRQEPVGYLFTDDPAVYAMPGSGFHSGKEPPADAINVVPVYAAPPAQAVDLGPVRDALKAAEGLATICASVDGYSREEVAASGRAMRKQFADALAEVDSQAVGNG